MANEETSVGALTDQLRELGLKRGDIVMVHASLKAVGAVAGGPEGVLKAILDAIGPDGTLLAYVSWERSPYAETLNGRWLAPEDKAAWPAFDPATSPTFPAWGYLNHVIWRHPGMKRSTHPDASMAAIGPMASTLVDPHELDAGYGAGSPLERLVERGGKVLLLGAPLDAITVLHYAEAIARIPDKRRVRYEVPVVDEHGEKTWVPVEHWDTNGITDRFAHAAQHGGLDAVETIARAYVMFDRHAEGTVGHARSYLFDARDLVKFGVRFLERHFG